MPDAAPTPIPTEADILVAITEIARRKVGWEGEVAPEMRLVEDLALDSLRLLTLAVEVEDHFQVCLDPEDEAAIETVRDLVEVVRRKLTAPPGLAAEGAAP